MSVILTRIIVTAFSLVLVSELIPGIEVSSVWSALFAAFLMGILNVLVRPVLLLLTLPITLLTLGLFIFVINATIFGVTALFVHGFSVSGFFPALFGSLIVTMISTFINKRV
jgi:putative membrane protein